MELKNKKVVNITEFFKNGRNAETGALDQLFPHIYNELRKLAHKQLQRSWSDETICTTALVNEAYLKLANGALSKLSNRAHFFAVAATAMRQILINYAEQKSAKKRGRDWLKVSFAESNLGDMGGADNLLQVNEALEDIRSIDEELAQLVELRFFGGLTEVEIAQVFKVNERTVRRNWKKAKALLALSLKGENQ